MDNDINNARILVVTSTFPRYQNDTEPAFVLDLCRYLKKYGYTIDVIAPHAEGTRKKEIINGISIFRYRYFFPSFEKLAYSGGILANLKKNRLNYLLIPFFILFQFAAICLHLQKYKYNLIHAHWLIPQGFLCILAKYIIFKKNIPVICTSHGGDLYGIQSPLLNYLKKWIMTKSDHVCVVSKAMKNVCTKMGINKDKLSVMSMGVDLKERFTPVPEITRRLNRLIFVGRFVEKKGIVNLLQAFTLVTQQKPEVELYLVGGGTLRDYLEERTYQLGINEKVFFYGSVTQEELPSLYSSSTIAVIPSIIEDSGDQEGLGLVIIEAMGCGCAVIASSLDAIKDVVIDNVNGLLVVPGEINELAKKILYLLDNEKSRKNLAKNARDSVVKKYSWEHCAKKYDDLFNSLLKKNLFPEYS